MADGLFYNDTREPFIGSVLPLAVTLAGTNKALYTAAAFPVLGGQYFSRVGKKLHIRLFGQMTTGITPGNLTFGVYYGTGADANGVLLASGAAQTLIASRTNDSWAIDIFVRCLTIGATGTLMATGSYDIVPTLSAAGGGLLPASAPVASGACDLTAALILSVQALRSGSTGETMQVADMEVIAMN
jgi:hypothetical protein